MLDEHFDNFTIHKVEIFFTPNVHKWNNSIDDTSNHNEPSMHSEGQEFQYLSV